MSDEHDQKSVLVPRLRFPEFREAGEWDETQLSQALKFQPGYPFPSKGFNSEGVGLRLIRNRDLRSDEKPVHFFGIYNDDFVVDDGDILVGMDGDFTPCIWRKGKALLNQRVGRVLPKKGSDQRFLFHLLSVHLKAIEDITARTTVKHLSHSDVERICEPLPKWPEQQKIADCLSSLDELIAAEAQKLDALKTHKKGLMQQIFPAEGETVPRLRFPEFRAAGEWEAQPLRRVAQLLDGDWIESKDQSADGVRLIQTGNIGIGDFIPKDGNARFISEETFRRLKCTQVVPGDCLISRLPDPAGRSCLVPDMGSKMITAVDCTIVRFNLQEIVPYLFISFSQTDQYFSEVQAQASGSTRLRISRENLSNIEIPLAALPEQQKIADCLSALDALITAQAQKIELLKRHKKGLMQQLFPVLEEVQA